MIVIYYVARITFPI